MQADLADFQAMPAAADLAEPQAWQAADDLPDPSAIQVQEQTWPATAMKAVAVLPGSHAMEVQAIADVYEIIEVLQNTSSSNQLPGSAGCTRDDMELCSTAELTEIIAEYYSDSK